MTPAMHWTKTFIRQYLLPAAGIILLFAGAVVLFLAAGTSSRIRTVFILVPDFILILLLLALIIRNILKTEAEKQSISERIQETDEKYRSLLETSAEGILILIDREIVQANLIFLAMSGYTMAELMAMKLEELIRGKDSGPLSPEHLYRELLSNDPIS